MSSTGSGSDSPSRTRIQMSLARQQLERARIIQEDNQRPISVSPEQHARQSMPMPSSGPSDLDPDVVPARLGNFEMSSDHSSTHSNVRRSRSRKRRIGPAPPAGTLELYF